jgi:hypothetical protein
MNARAYPVISGVIFGVVAILHLIRVVNGWAFQLGPWSLPMWISWLGTIGPAVLCVWAIRLASRWNIASRRG